MFIKIKNEEVTIKGRGCTHIRSQWNWMSKEETTFTTVSNDGLMLSCMIDTMEVWGVATSDIPGVFL